MDDDPITLIMNGVGPMYEATINLVRARDNPISLDNLVRILLSEGMHHEE